MKTLLAAAVSFVLVAGAVSADAKGSACRDAKGKFIKCPDKAAAPAPTKCRTAKGKFAKCGTPGAIPAK